MNTRHNCLEVPLSDTEKTRIAEFCARIGLARAVFARLSMSHFIEADGIPGSHKVESLPCRDAPVASRASGGNFDPAHRRRSLALPGRKPFGYRTPRRLL